MNATKMSWIKKFVLALTVLLLVFSLAAPIALAQDDKDINSNELNSQIDDNSKQKVNDTVKACEEGTGGISIVVCPVVNLLVRGITRLTLGGGGQEAGQRQSPLISFLAVTPPRAKTANGQPSPLANVVSNVIVIANSIYILVFLILIFGSSLPFFTAQNYTIKKTLPKLILAVILTQFTLPITGLIIDFFNLLGYAIPNILLALGQVPTTLTGTGSTAAKVGGGVGLGIAGGLGAAGIVSAGFGWIFIIGFLVVALISILVAFVYMIVRYFLIYVLILIAPLAFVAWVIPGTEKFFKQWWTDFIRLNAMFVTIMALLSGSVVIASALSGQQDTNLGFLPAVMPIIALFLIPKTLKATTKGLSALSGAVLGAAGAATGKATGAVKSKGKEAASGQLQQTRNDAAAKAFGKNTDRGRRAAAIFQGKLPTQKGQFQAGRNVATYNAEQRKIKTEGIEFQGSKLDFGTYKSELKQAASGKGSRILGITAGDKNAQIAAGNILAQRGAVEEIREIYRNGDITPSELGEIVQPSFGDIKAAAPDLATGARPGDPTTGGGMGKAYEGLSAEKIASLDASSIKELSAHHDSSAASAGSSLALQKQLQRIKDDPNLYNKLSQDQIDALNSDSRAKAGGIKI